MATMNGVIYAFEAVDTPFDPRRHSITAQTHAGADASFGIRGSDRGYKDTRGDHLVVPFDVFDDRFAHKAKAEASSAAYATPNGAPYNITVSLIAPGFRRTVHMVVDVPGHYAVTLEAPMTRSRGKIVLLVHDGAKIFSHDAYGVSFHMRCDTKK